jgi:Virulence factor
MSTSKRRPRSRSEIVTIWWRDIPTQVNGVNGAQIEKCQLSHRFLWAAQRAAKKADLMDSHSFTAQTRRTETKFDPSSGELHDIVWAEAARIEGLYDDQRLAALVEAGGIAANAPAHPRPRLRIIRSEHTG